MTERTRELQAGSGSVLPSVEQDIAGVKRMTIALDTLIREVLKQGEDYGIIPGTQKPTLLKPGSEKILGMLNCSSEVSIVEKIEDHEKGFFSYVTKVSAIHRGTGTCIGEGIGSCNSQEKRYKNQDPFQLHNTVLKMAKKRAQIDCALTVGMASEKFTQDMEDYKAEDGRATPPQCAFIFRLLRSPIFTDAEREKALTFLEESPTKERMSEFIDRIKARIAQAKETEKGAGGRETAHETTQASDPSSDPAQEPNTQPDPSRPDYAAFLKACDEYESVLGNDIFRGVLRKKGYSAANKVPPVASGIQEGILTELANAVNLEAEKKR